MKDRNKIHLQKCEIVDWYVIFTLKLSWKWIILGYYLFDKVSYNGKEYFIFGQRKSGFLPMTTERILFMKSMKRKINLQFWWIAGLSSVLTAAFVTIIFFQVFQQEVFEDLKTYAKLLESSGVLEQEEQTANLENFGDLRITVIAEDGTVVFDNYAETEQLDNHADRIEVEQAFQKGFGQKVRRSVTLQESTFYYALPLSGNRVLRVAKDAGSIWGIVIKAVPLTVLVMLFMFGICTAVARMLAKSMLNPIEQMAEHLDDEKGVIAYRELTPFIEMIQKQHADILKGAKMRQEFTANVSHELKTPLTAISGYAELIENGMASAEHAVAFAAEIHKSSNRLLKLINDIIRLSELDSSRVQMELEQVDLYECAKECMDWLLKSAKDHGVTMQLFGTKEIVYADRNMMEELIYNLCDNAIRYNNPGGKVSITITKYADCVYLIVKDDGIGISKEHQERIFERFYRVDKSRSKSTGGTGLGLAIVKHILAQHQIEMELVSEIGKGTEIKVIFRMDANEKLMQQIK